MYSSRRIRKSWKLKLMEKIEKYGLLGLAYGEVLSYYHGTENSLLLKFKA